MAVENRPAIPTLLERRVLMESGHRCAIPTCSYPTVEIHHIVPWEKCKEHTYDNLIALCPNCHSRADRGEIDRKSLLLYKSRLQSIFSCDSLQTDKPITTLNGSDDVRYKVKAINYNTSSAPWYEIEIDLPIFDEQTVNGANEINLVLQGSVFNEIHRFRSLMNDWQDHVDADLISQESILNGSYHISLLTDSMVSLSFSYMQYCAGAAQPSNWLQCFNYQLKPVRLLEMENLIEDYREAMDFISKFCFGSLCEEFGIDPDSTENSYIFKEMTVPELSNFQLFNLNSNCLIIVFNGSKVGRWFGAGRIVEIPISQVQHLLKKEVIASF